MSSCRCETVSNQSPDCGFCLKRDSQNTEGTPSKENIMGSLMPITLKGQVHPAFGGSTPTSFWKSRLPELPRKWRANCQGCWTSISLFPWTRPVASNCGLSRLSPLSELDCISSEMNHSGWPEDWPWASENLWATHRAVLYHLPAFTSLQSVSFRWPDPARKRF